MQLAKDAPHPNAARIYIDWLSSPQGMPAYRDHSYFHVLSHKVADKAPANVLSRSMGWTWEPLPKDVLTPENLHKSKNAN